MKLDLKIPAPLKPQDRPAPTAPEHSRSILFGTGLDKKLGAKAGTQFDKFQDATHTLADAARIDDLVDTQLPSTLTPDDIVLDGSQEIACNGIVRNKYGIIIGKAGTGKTTVTKFSIARIVSEFVQRYDRKPIIKIVAYTGRAVQQAKRAMTAEYQSCCDTMHGFLEFAPEDVEVIDSASGMPITSRRFIPHRTMARPLDCDIVFIDEAGMMPIDLWNQFIDASTDDMRIYLIGDIYQLPPVHGRSVLGFAMLKWPTFELDRIHRTENDAIIDVAWSVMNGRMPQKAAGSVLLKEISDASLDAYQQVLGVVEGLSAKGIFEPLRDAIIVPQNGDSLGQETFNERLCAFFNPTRRVDGLPINPRIIITAGYHHKSFSVGDKIMVTENDRQLGLTNGMIGVIEGISRNDRFKGDSIGDMAAAHLDEGQDLDVSALSDLVNAELTVTKSEREDARERQASHIVTVRFQNMDEPVSFSSAGAINSLKHAYAFTCHKSQGGEYDVVIVVVHSTNLNMLSREWLYTACTRAKSKLIILYNSRGINKALAYQVIKGQTLADKAKRFIEIQEQRTAGKEIQAPILFDPVEI